MIIINKKMHQWFSDLKKMKFKLKIEILKKLFYKKILMNLKIKCYKLNKKYKNSVKYKT